jgi:NADH-quinone oxidoreductase subunit J
MESLGSLIIYGIIVAAIIIFSILAVTTRRILRAATYLLFSLFATAGLYFALDYEFLGAVQIAVYAGGIVVLVVFAILLTSHPGQQTDLIKIKNRTAGLIAAVAAAVVLGGALLLSPSMLSMTMPSASELTMNQLGTLLLGTGKYQYLLPFEAVSILLLACIIGGIVVARKR